MKDIYTFAGYPAKRLWTVGDLIRLKGKRKFSQTTAESVSISTKELERFVSDVF